MIWEAHNLSLLLSGGSLVVEGWLNSYKVKYALKISIKVPFLVRNDKNLDFSENLICLNMIVTTLEGKNTSGEREPSWLES